MDRYLIYEHDFINDRWTIVNIGPEQGFLSKEDAQNAMDELELNDPYGCYWVRPTSWLQDGNYNWVN